MIDTELHFGAWRAELIGLNTFTTDFNIGVDAKGEVKRRVPGIFILLEICSATHGPFILTLMNQMFDF